MVGRVQALGAQVEGARVMDVGTGWALDMPIALFLSGAARIQTFDLHAYLRPKRVEQTLDSIRGMRDQAMEIFGPFTNRGELERRLEAVCQARTAQDLMRVANIEYFAPADATKNGASR